jgi:hypothetical protein
VCSPGLKANQVKCPGKTPVLEIAAEPNAESAGRADDFPDFMWRY